MSFLQNADKAALKQDGHGFLHEVLICFEEKIAFSCRRTAERVQ